MAKGRFLSCRTFPILVSCLARVRILGYDDGCLSGGGFRVFGIESVSHRRVVCIAMGALLAYMGGLPIPPRTFLEEFYFADGLIARGNQHRSGRPASAPGCHVTAAHPAITDGDGDHHHPLALQDRGHLFAHRRQDGMNSFGRLFPGTLVH